jgi:histone-lysine N-methyltransferase SETMAR
LLELLLIKHHGWHFVITLDGSWFYRSPDHGQIWLQADQEPPEQAKDTIQDQKIMVTIAWNPLGFHLVEILPKGRSFNAEYYRDNILTELIQFRPEAGERYLVIHVDNPRPHTAQNCGTFCAENGLRPATHPPCSPDLAPSDFFLFGDVKHCLHGIIFSSGEELLGGICGLVGEIPLETLAHVFEHWTERPRC